LLRSDIVANCTMNRQREIVGTNGYAADLRMSPLDFLEERMKQQKSVAWLDLCCGSGKALIQAAKHFVHVGVERCVTIHGVDLVSMFAPIPATVSKLTFEAASVLDIVPDTQYDLITCVHGLHYVGDKLRMLALAASWLKSDGLFIAHLDIDNIKLIDRQPCKRFVGRELKQASILHDRRFHLVSCQGRRLVDLPLIYEGADDKIGPNFTGQAAVDSYYSCQATLAHK